MIEHVVIIAIGALGAWLLVAGPVYQGALELREEEIDQEKINAVASSLDPEPKPSSWWWFLPPVALIKRRGWTTRQREAMVHAMDPEQVRQMVTFLNKANGWFAVAAGASLIAIKETWEFVELVRWPDYVTWVIVVLALGICIGNVIYQMARAGRVLASTEEKLIADGEIPGGRRGAERAARQKS
ncbi:MAG: hypothetical protein JWP75_3095 [Frondihabitans sp.]|nr:hypothetical protein [Frondihabitans sp.]